jgi:uridine kinase
MHFEFVEPSKRHADLIIPEGGNPEIGVGFLCGLIREKLRKEENIVVN